MIFIYISISLPTYLPIYLYLYLSIYEGCLEKNLAINASMFYIMGLDTFQTAIGMVCMYVCINVLLVKTLIYF